MESKELAFPNQHSHLPPAADDGEQQSVDLRGYLLVILNRRWMILAVTCFAVIAVAIYSYLQTPVYRSKAVLEIDLPSSYALASNSSTLPSYWRNRDPYIKTQYRLLKGKNLAVSVAEKLNLSLKDLKLPEDDPARTGARPATKDAEIDAVAALLLQMVSIQPIRETNLCEIIFVTPNPNLSRMLALAWAEGYVDQHLDSMQQYTRKAEELLTGQIDHLQKEISEKEKLLYDYSIKNQIVKPDKTKSMASYALSDVNNALNSATQDRISAEVRYGALKATSKERLPEVLGHPSVQRLQMQYSDLEKEYRDKSKIFKPDYPEMIRLKSELDQTALAIEAQMGKAYEEVLAGARSEAQQASSKEGALRNQLGKARRETVEAGRQELSYDQLVMEIENKKLLMTSLLQRQNETGVSAQVQERKMSTTRIIEHPELPKGIFKPNIQKNVMFALMAGLFGGIAFALAFEFFDRSIKSPEDIERYIHLPFLGIVPRYSVSDGNGHGHKQGSKMLMRRKAAEITLDFENGDLLTANDPLSYASEAIKTIRTSLLLAYPEAPPRSILITSSRAGEGKTFIATNLAIALTQLDKKVVLIDADMRNPRVHRIWDADNSTGLSIYLTSDVPVSTIVRPSSVNRLSFISSGPKTPRPAELLASSRFETLLRELEKEFDFVILDSPPVLPVADSVILASKAKSVLIVIYGGFTPRDVVKMAKRKLSASNPSIVGTIVNGIDFNDPYYYYRYYSSYSYRYYGEAEPAQKSS